MLELGGNQIIIDSTYFHNNGGETVHPNGSIIINGDVFAINFGSASGCIISNCRFSGFTLRTPFDFATSGGLNSILGCTGFSASGGANALHGNLGATDFIDYRQGGTDIDWRRPQAHKEAADDAGAASAGLLVGGVYLNSSTKALTIRSA